MKKTDLQKLNIPDKPGVYFFLKGKEILYIGKATSLGDRVKSYFDKDLIETRGPIVLDMVFKADKIKWQTADSMLEALILEAELIKKHQPKYNTKEKSDKSFNYVCITKEKLPKVIIVRGKNVKHQMFNKIFGPYTNSSQLKEAMKIIRPIFPFLDEKSKNYYKFYKQVDLVPDISSTNGIKKYKNDIKNLELFFEGKKKRILENLQKEMKKYAKQREFEKAGEVKRQIFALQHINDVALITSDTKISLPISSLRIEAYDIAHMSGKNIVGVMTVIENREVAKHQYRKFKIKTQSGTNDTGALKEVLERRLAHPEWPFPAFIVVDGGIAQINTAKAILAKMGPKIDVISVLKDERHKPKNIIGDKNIVSKYKREILLINSEAHRFAINYHKNMRTKNFLK